MDEHPAVAQREKTTLYLVDKPGAAQSVIAAGQVGVPRSHPDYVPLTVMNMAFGGQFTARLNMNLREDKGYTYGYRSRFDWRKSGSTYVAGGSVQTDVTREALVETLKEYRDLHDDRPINEEEFEKAQLGLIRGFPPTFETPSQVLRRLLDIVHFGLPDDYFSGQVARYEAVTLEDVRRVAAEHVDPDALSILVVGDRAVIEGPMRELGPAHRPPGLRRPPGITASAAATARGARGAPSQTRSGGRPPCCGHAAICRRFAGHVADWPRPEARS